MPRSVLLFFCLSEEPVQEAASRRGLFLLRERRAECGRSVFLRPVAVLSLAVLLGTGLYRHETAAIVLGHDLLNECSDGGGGMVRIEGNQHFSRQRFGRDRVDSLLLREPRFDQVSERL